MPRVKHNYRKTVQDVVDAFFDGRSRRTGGGRYETDGSAVYIWRNKVAEKRPEGLWISDAGWQTVITKQMLNHILSEAASRGAIPQPLGIYQKKHEWYIGEADWPGEIVLPYRSPEFERQFGRRAGRPASQTELFENPPRRRSTKKRSRRKVRQNLHTVGERNRAINLIDEWAGRAMYSMQRYEMEDLSHALGVINGVQKVAELEKRGVARSVISHAKKTILALRREWRSMRKARA